MNISPSKTPPSNPLLRALARWETEGGASQLLPTDVPHTAILQHLGAAVLMRWKGLSTETQRDLFDAAVGMEDSASNEDLLRQHLAVFLHQHKNDELSADVGGEA